MLPCLIAQGSDWKFILAEKTLAGEVVSSRRPLHPSAQ